MMEFAWTSYSWKHVTGGAATGEIAANANNGFQQWLMSFRLSGVKVTELRETFHNQEPSRRVVRKYMHDPHRYCVVARNS